MLVVFLNNLKGFSLYTIREVTAIDKDFIVCRYSHYKSIHNWFSCNFLIGTYSEDKCYVSGHLWLQIYSQIQEGFISDLVMVFAWDRVIIVKISASKCLMVKVILLVALLSAESTNFSCACSIKDAAISVWAKLVKVSLYYKKKFFLAVWFSYLWTMKYCN